MPPEDDFRRDVDPRTRRNAVVLGLVLAGCLAAVPAALWARGQPSTTAAQRMPTAQVTRPSPPTAPPQSTAPPPSPRPTPVPATPLLGFGFGAAYDARSHQLVTFGGVDSYDTTWLWDGHRWTLARPAVSPPGRFHGAAAYDPVTGVVMLFGGRLGDGPLLQDTWAWNGTTWQQLDAGVSTLPSYATMAWDDTLSEMVLVDQIGSGTWTWNGSTWVQRPLGALPNGTFLIGMAQDPLTRALLGVSCCSQGHGDTSTFSWNGNGWQRVSTRAVPGFTVSMVPDPLTARILMFADPSIAAEVWSWTGRDWSLVPDAQVPVFPTVAVVDTDTHRVVIIGSAAEPVQGSPQPVQLWTLIGPSWQQLS